MTAVGRQDISGDDWSDIFAAAVNATPINIPIGLADVALGKTAWSAKTIKANNPLTVKEVRFIIARAAPVYSFGTTDPLADVEETGKQVLNIWNARVSEAMEQFGQLRTIALVRDMVNFRFRVFELQTTQFDPADYRWTRNERGNLEGHSRDSSRHTFTWQPHGAQLTVLRPVSGSARSFQIKKPDPLDPSKILETTGFSDDWVTFL